MAERNETMREAAALLVHQVERGEEQRPQVMLAVADWMLATAQGLERRGVRSPLREDEKHALTLARDLLAATHRGR